MHVLIPGETFDATEHGNAMVIADMFGVRVPWFAGLRCPNTSPVNALGTHWLCTRAYGHERRCHHADQFGRVYAVWHQRDV